MARVLATISGKDKETMRALINEHGVDVIRQSARDLGQDRGYKVDAVVDEDMIEKLESAGYRVEKGEDVDEVGKNRQALVGSGNRYL